MSLPKIYLLLLLQSHIWQFTPSSVKPYSLKAVLQASFQPVALGNGEIISSPKKNRNLIHIVGSGVCAEIQVCSVSVNSRTSTSLSRGRYNVQATCELILSQFIFIFLITKVVNAKLHTFNTQFYCTNINLSSV